MVANGTEWHSLDLYEDAKYPRDERHGDNAPNGDVPNAAAVGCEPVDHLGLLEFTPRTDVQTTVEGASWLVIGAGMALQERGNLLGQWHNFETVPAGSLCDLPVFGGGGGEG